MADLVECSRPTIQAIELGKLSLSDKLAERIQHETGVSLEWLLANDTAKPPIGSLGEPYSSRVFDAHQSQKKRSYSTPNDLFYMQLTMGEALDTISYMVLESFGNNRLELCAFKLSQALSNLRKELGIGNHPISKSGLEILKAASENSKLVTETIIHNRPLRKPLRVIRLSNVVEEFEDKFWKLCVQRNPGAPLQAPAPQSQKQQEAFTEDRSAPPTAGKPGGSPTVAPAIHLSPEQPRKKSEKT